MEELGIYLTNFLLMDFFFLFFFFLFVFAIISSVFLSLTVPVFVYVSEKTARSESIHFEL